MKGRIIRGTFLRRTESIKVKTYIIIIIYTFSTACRRTKLTIPNPVILRSVRKYLTPFCVRSSTISRNISLFVISFVKLPDTVLFILLLFTRLNDGVLCSILRSRRHLNIAIVLCYYYYYYRVEYSAGTQEVVVASPPPPK